MTSISNFWLLVGFWRCVWALSDVTPTPVVIWHGSGDSADGLPKSMMALIQENINGTYVKRIQIGSRVVDQIHNSLFLHPDVQISSACTQIRNDPNLSKGYNAIGLSQGGLFIRAVAQRCPEPPMKKLITLGAPHQGVYGLPRCQSMQMFACEVIRQFLYLTAYKSSTQTLLVPATYWHDPFNEEMYRSQSTFLSDINNERGKNEEYSRNLQKLERFVMVKFLNDTVTQPKETHWIEFYIPGQDREILPLRQSKMYLEDQLGLAQMDVNGKLVFLQVEGEHLSYTKDWFIKNVLIHLKN